MMPDGPPSSMGRPFLGGPPRRAAFAPAALRPRRFGLPYVRKNRGFGNPAPRFPAAESSRPGASPPETATAASRDGETGGDCQNPDFPAHGEAGTRRRGRSRPTPRPEAGPRSSAWRYAPNGGSERVSHVKHSGFSTAPCGEGRSGRFPERIAASPAAR